MSETLEIRNFGPIDYLKIDIKPITILIGEQATGKSTVAKLLSVCRFFSYILPPEEKYIITSFETGLIDWGMVENIREGSYVKYICSHYELTVNAVRKIELDSDPETGDEGSYYFDIEQSLSPKSEEFKGLMRELDKVKKSNRSGYIPNVKPLRMFSEPVIPTSFFQNDVKAVMDNPLYIPTERGLQSIFSLGRNSSANISNMLYNYFAKVDEILKLYKDETKIEPLNIIYKNNRRSGGYIKKEGTQTFFNIENAASGYQSTVPVVLIIKYYSELYKRSKTFTIEEPELNLFPSAQNDLVKFLVDYTINYNNHTLITTHSPYILSALNNLMYAYQIGATHTLEVETIIAQKYWIDPKQVSAYRLLNNGRCKNIVDQDLNEIVVEEIDGVSKEINSVYDRILDVKFAENEKSE